MIKMKQFCLYIMGLYILSQKDRWSVKYDVTFKSCYQHFNLSQNIQVDKLVLVNRNIAELQGDV